MGVETGSTANRKGPVGQFPEAVRPRALRPGDRVRVLAPASPPQRHDLDRGVDLLRSWGLEVELGRHVFSRHGHYLAGADEDRAADLNEALTDPSVRAIFAARGGKGSYRILDQVDYAAARADPKPLLGFSDITYLQLALWRNAGLVTFQGPMACWDFDWCGPESAEALRSALMSTADIVLRSDPSEPTAAIGVDGVASGVLLGGNLTVLGTSVGWNCPMLDGAILFLEVADATLLGGADSALTQLAQSGILAGVQAVALGQVGNHTGARNDGWTIIDVLSDRLGRLGVPVLGGLRLGHGLHPLTVPLGIPARLDTAAGTLSVSAGVCVAVQDDRIVK